MASAHPPRQVIFESKVVHFRLFDDGTCEREETFLPAGVDPSSGVTSKDVTINADVTARLYLPKNSGNANTKLPVILYIHGGGFFVESPFSPVYHSYLNSLVSTSNALAVSVHYRRVPEHPVDVCYDDSFAALQWAASHLSGNGPDAWLNDHADLRRLYVVGDSAGGNITHHVVMRAGRSGGPHVEGAVLVQPHFWGKDRVPMEEDVDPAVIERFDKLWALACPKESKLGSDDPRINTVKAGGLEAFGSKRLLVCVAEKDTLRGRAWEYFRALRGSAWGGEVEIFESEGENHVFHLFNPQGEKANQLMLRISSFLNYK